MKHKFLVTALAAVSFLGSSFLLKSENAEASKIDWQHNEESWNGTGAVITTQNVIIQKKNIAKKYSKTYQTKKIRKNTKINVYPDAYHKNWVLFKKGYTHKGYIPDGNKSQPKHGYYWVIKKYWLNDKWFKMNPNSSWMFWQKPHAVKIIKPIKVGKYEYTYWEHNEVTSKWKSLDVFKGETAFLYHNAKWPSKWELHFYDDWSDPKHIFKYKINPKTDWIVDMNKYKNFYKLI